MMAVFKSELFSQIICITFDFIFVWAIVKFITKDALLIPPFIRLQVQHPLKARRIMWLFLLSYFERSVQLIGYLR